MSLGPYPWSNGVNTSNVIAGQAKATYLDYRKIKGFEDVGYFLRPYVVSGGEVTNNATRNDMVDVTNIVVSLNNDIMARDGAVFQTSIPSTVYYLDFFKDGEWSWGTAHPDGTVLVDYLTIAEVTTDSAGLVQLIGDTRGAVGGFRLKDSVMLPVIDVTEYAAVGDGTTDNTPFFQAIINDLSTIGGEIVFPSGTYKVDSSLTFPRNMSLWFINGSKIEVGSSATITVNGTIKAGDYQIFTPTGTVSLTSSEVNVQWFGALPGGADCTLAFNKAIAACRSGAKLMVPRSSDSFYRLSGTVTINKNISLCGENTADDQNGGNFGTRLTYFPGDYTTAINITSSEVEIKNIHLYKAGGDSLIYGLTASGMLGVNVESLIIRNFDYPVKFDNCIQCRFVQILVRDCIIGFRFETLGTSMYLEQCWIQNPSMAGYQFVNHAYCTLVNCLLDGSSTAGSEPGHAFKMTNCNTINLMGCASERVRRSHIYIETSESITVSNFFGLEGNRGNTYGHSFAFIATSGDNIAFINPYDRDPGAGTVASITSAGTAIPVIISPQLPHGFNASGTVVATPKNSINIGLSSFIGDGLILLSPDGTRHKISVSNSNVISATTV